LPYLLPALSGLLLALSFPKADISILAWVAFVPLLYRLQVNGPRRAFYSGLVTGFVFNLASVYWVINTMSNYGGLPLPVSLTLLVALSAYLALYFGVFSWLYSIVCNKRPALAFIAAPAFWVTLELARNYMLSGFPWDLIGYSQHANLRIIQVSDITGVYGVSALIVLINCAVTDIIITLSGKGPHVKARLAGPAVAVLALAAVAGYGQYRLAHMPKADGTLKVALIQGNIDQFHKWDPAFQNEVFETYKGLTEEAAAKKPDLVIWPETATPFIFGDSEKTSELGALVKSAGVYLMTGSPSVDSRPDGGYLEYNSAYLIAPDGSTAGRYDKMHLVPFGEYVPLKGLLPFVSKMVTAIGDFGTGTEYTLLKAGKGAFGTAICFEVIFPELVRHFPLSGANFLTSITNDAWFGRSAAPYQHFDMAVFRAVENKRALVRAANTGITGIILPSGEVAGKTDIFTRGSMAGEIPLVSELTFYTRHGDVFAYGCVVLSLALIAVAIIRRERRI